MPALTGMESPPSGAEPIRVLRVIARLNIGGPTLHVSYLTRELEERGYRTTLVAGRLSKGEESMGFVPDELGIRPFYLDHLQRRISPLADTVSVLQLVRLIRRLRPAVIHTHTAKAGAVSRTAALLARLEPRPVLVHTFHGHVLHRTFEPPVERIFRAVERRLARHTDALVVVAPQLRDDLVALGIAPPEKFVVIRLGIDLERRVDVREGAREDVRAELGVSEEGFLVAWFARMTAVKNPGVLLRAFARLRSKGVDATLALVGDGPLRQELEDLAAQLGIADRVRFLGFREDVGSLYAACDVVALSSNVEGTPVTLIEALAAGKPVVSTAVDGVADVVRDDGLLVPLGDHEAMAEALERLARDPALREELGTRGAERVRAQYAVSRLVDDVDRLYRRLLAGRE